MYILLAQYYTKVSIIKIKKVSCSLLQHYVKTIAYILNGFALKYSLMHNLSTRLLFVQFGAKDGFEKVVFLTFLIKHFIHFIVLKIGTSGIKKWKLRYFDAIITACFSFMNQNECFLLNMILFIRIKTFLFKLKV